MVSSGGWLVEMVVFSAEEVFVVAGTVVCAVTTGGAEVKVVFT
jgi:hypothetical protein